MEKTKPLDTRRRRAAGPIRLALLLLSLLAMSACDRGTPEAALRAQLAEMQAAASEQRAGDFMEGVASDFAGNDGMDRAALHNLLRMQMLGRTRVGVTTGPLEVEMKGGGATVRMSVVVTGGSALLPDSAQVYAITSGWRLESGQWRVYYAQWESGL